MKFSILIAHYNNAQYFKECFESLIAQTYSDWEAIILDDCSVRDDQEMIKNIIKNDSRFIYYENKINKGVGFTKGKLIELASGQILGFVDPDDAILPEALEKSMLVFANKKEVVLTYSRFISCDKNLKPLLPSKAGRQIENDNPLFFNCPIVINHFVCFSKKDYEKTEKINPDLKIAEDQDLYLKLYERGKVVFINENNYLYRFHGGGISQNENKKKSYEYWGKVIFDAMKRRGLTTIDGKKIPENFTNSQEIFALLAYQNSISYRIKKKFKIFFQSLFNS